MRRASHLAILAVAIISVLGIFAASAYATPDQTVTCSICHSGTGVTVKATLKSSTATTTTYNVVVTGGMAWAVFNGSTKVTDGTSTTGTFTVNSGSTYTIYGVNGPGMTDGIGSTTVSPTAPTPTPTPTPTQTAPPTPTPTPTPTGVDTTPPDMSATNVAANYTGKAVITLTATDKLTGSDTGVWGVADIYYQVDYNPPNSGATHVYELTAPAFTGTYTVTIPGPAAGSGLKVTHTITYWAQDAAGNSGQTLATTKTFTITAAKLATSVKLSRSASTVKVNQYFTLSGAISPTTVAPVAIQYEKPGTHVWRTLVTTKTSSKSTYSYRYRTTLKGVWSFRVYYSGSTTRLASYSPTVTVRVK